MDDYTHGFPLIVTTCSYNCIMSLQLVQHRGEGRYFRKLKGWAWPCRDYWARFERFVSLLTRTCDDVYIVTGPLYLPFKTPLGYMMQHPMIGDHTLTMIFQLCRGS